MSLPRPLPIKRTLNDRQTEEIGIIEALPPVEPAAKRPDFNDGITSEMFAAMMDYDTRKAVAEALGKNLDPSDIRGQQHSVYPNEPIQTEQCSLQSIIDELITVYSCLYEIDYRRIRNIMKYALYLANALRENAAHIVAQNPQLDDVRILQIASLLHTFESLMARKVFSDTELFQLAISELRNLYESPEMLRITISYKTFLNISWYPGSVKSFGGTHPIVHFTPIEPSLRQQFPVVAAMARFGVMQRPIAVHEQAEPGQDFEQRVALG